MGISISDQVTEKIHVGTRHSQLEIEAEIYLMWNWSECSLLFNCVPC